MSKQGSTRRRWGAAAVAAAAAAGVVAASAVWWPDTDEAQVRPALAPYPWTPADLAVAEDFTAASAAHDADAVAALLPAGEELDEDQRAGLRRDDVWNVEYLVEPCRFANTNDFGTLFVCPFDLHVLYSQEVGRGPFKDNHFEVWVKDGEVVAQDNIISWETNGVNDHLNAVDAWVEENHPGETDFLFQDEQDLGATEWPRWTRLWEKRGQEYVDSMASEGNG